MTYHNILRKVSVQQLICNLQSFKLILTSFLASPAYLLWYLSRFHGLVMAYSYYLHSIPSSKQFNRPFFAFSFLPMIFLKETLVLTSFLPPRFCFSSCHNSRNAILSLSQFHPLFWAQFKFFFLCKAFLKHPSLYHSPFALFPILCITLTAGSKAHTIFCCFSVILSEVDFLKKSVSVEKFALLPVSLFPQK